MATGSVRSLVIDLFESPNGTVYGILIATFIVILTTGLYQTHLF